MRYPGTSSSCLTITQSGPAMSEVGPELFNRGMSVTVIRPSASSMRTTLPGPCPISSQPAVTPNTRPPTLCTMASSFSAGDVVPRDGADDVVGAGGGWGCAVVSSSRATMNATASATASTSGSHGAHRRQPSRRSAAAGSSSKTRTAVGSAEWMRWADGGSTNSMRLSSGSRSRATRPSG